MIGILAFLARLSIIIGLAGAAFAGISDLIMKTDYLVTVDNTVNLGSVRVQIVLVLLAILYLVIFLLSYINKFTKYSQNKKVKTKTGEIEVSIKTINEVAKDFLSSQEIIKNSKVKSHPKGRAVVIEAVVDTYNVNNLSDKLLKIQEKLSEYVSNSTGITVKKSKVKLKKVLGETIVEKKIIEAPKEEIKVVKADIEKPTEEVKETVVSEVTAAEDKE
ncbi:alkaline shock response membrane anchor protein AmaP [Pseudoleptotrichia goodfellowii]|uniref:Alkaline shock response membrane anchor protein AmaP n=2 Tax=Pseudoleptotrichia goodfellowii TaxID=157692 RepID=D0GKE2_9FUSO|nr:alkaline shock response membrane anchor protein AmaP [Pseudoleptotrichia goodfellowii]EEY35444.1 hypothetical protein HMPREF0554_0685 [Pseudoleptotrichia goodfellowii F0264]BBM37108.1 hypothetical protein JCM16774_2060 [Pseudoleptotrichia goodfellowii]